MVKYEPHQRFTRGHGPAPGRCCRSNGIDQKTLSNYENGKTQPDARALIALADFFHVSIDYLVGRTDMPSLDAQSISDELLKVQMQLEKIKSELLK